MKYILFCAACFLSLTLFSLEYEVQFENADISMVRVKIMPKEEIGYHRDALPQIVVALQGGTITRLEANGTTTEVQFPTGVAIYREIDPPDELHLSVNYGSEPVELIIVQLKNR